MKKPSEYNEVHQPENLKIRPIVAGPTCVMNYLNNFLDILLKPFQNHVKSYVKNSVDFLNKLPKRSHEKEVLITFDITSMYTNIDHNLANKALQFWLSAHPECLPMNILKEFVLEVLSIVLKFNTSTYSTVGDVTGLQIRGLSMVTKAAPTVATTLSRKNMEEKYKRNLYVTSIDS